MDQSTHEIRLANWMQIINNCQSRPKEQTTKQWLTENQISEKQYYYWLRKVRKQAYSDSKVMLPEVQRGHAPAAVSVFVLLVGVLALNNPSFLSDLFQPMDTVSTQPSESVASSGESPDSAFAGIVNQKAENTEYPLDRIDLKPEF